ncbi:MAG: tripartite tricarboxylate transporter substrate binding protein [Betaproteobacteria bacterium]|nr:tripartite tricarboxylate transporter substrate binding protein [Betaproteobacteria bacterium]
MKRTLAAVVALGCMFASAHAQQFPSKPIRFIVPFTPGGGTDTFARSIQPKLSDALGQQMVVDNRPGAQGSIGTALGAQAPADGHTIILGFIGTLAINPHLYRNVGYDPLKDFAAAARGTAQPYVLVVHPSLPVKTVKDLTALAKKNPNELAFGSSSSAAQLAVFLFKIVTGSEVLHVPYKGASPALLDLLGGNIGMLFAAPAGPMGHVQSGRLRALVVTGSTRVPAYPDVPTSAEAGYPDLEVTGWYGVVLPAQTPKQIVSRIGAEVIRAMEQPDVRKRLDAAGLTPAPASSAEFAEFIKSEYVRWGKVAKTAGLKVD